MKTSILRFLSAICLLSSVVSTSTAAVEVISATQTKVDGSPAGDIANALRAFPARSAEILAAIDARLKSADDGVRSLQADRDSQVTTLTAQLQAVQTAKAQLETDKAADDERVASLVDVVAFVQSSGLPANLKASLDDARQSAADKKVAELQAQQASISAQLSKLAPVTDAGAAQVKK